MQITISIGAGELFDKVSILEIKKSKITDEKKLKNIRIELAELNHKFIPLVGANEVLKELYDQLFSINSKLWEIEDEIRKLDKEKNFGDNFVTTARLVYHYNDQRANIKKQVNIFTNSTIIEEKSYEEY